MGTCGSSADRVVHQWQNTSSTTYGLTLNTNPYGGFWTCTQKRSLGAAADTGMTDWNRDLITNADHGVQRGRSMIISIDFFWHGR